MSDYECYEKIYGHLAGWVTHYPKTSGSREFKKHYWKAVYERQP